MRAHTLCYRNILSCTAPTIHWKLTTSSLQTASLANGDEKNKNCSICFILRWMHERDEPLPAWHFPPLIPSCWRCFCRAFLRIGHVPRRAGPNIFRCDGDNALEALDLTLAVAVWRCISCKNIAFLSSSGSDELDVRLEFRRLMHKVWIKQEKRTRPPRHSWSHGIVIQITFVDKS